MVFCPIGAIPPDWLIITLNPAYPMVPPFT
jgi:hypothetical protein